LIAGALFSDRSAGGQEDIRGTASVPDVARRFYLSTEFAFLASGVFIMVAAWAFNLVGTVSGDQGSVHGGLDIYLWLILIFQGLAFSSMGVISSNYREFLANPTLAKRYLVGILLIADGGLHLLALNQHLTIIAAAAFFAVVAPIQLLGGMLFPSLPRRLDRFWLLFTGFLIAAFVVTRTVPIWPINVVEEVDPLGLISKGVEFATVWTLISLVRTKSAKNRSPQPMSPVKGP
jgi:hypothetical protein